MPRCFPLVCSIVVTLRSGQGVRSLSLRLRQNPAPHCGPWAFAFAPLQASSLSASPRFLFIVVHHFIVGVHHVVPAGLAAAEARAAHVGAGAAGLTALAVAVFYRGLRMYASGNLMEARL